MTRPEEILTERLRLRPPAEADAEQIFARYGQDPEVCRYMSWTPHRSIDDTLRVPCAGSSATTPKAAACGYLIFSRESGELLGSVGGAIEGHRMQFGYCLARDAWGHGIRHRSGPRVCQPRRRHSVDLADPGVLRRRESGVGPRAGKGRADARRHAAALHGAAQSGRRRRATYFCYAKVRDD